MLIKSSCQNFYGSFQIFFWNFSEFDRFGATEKPGVKNKTVDIDNFFERERGGRVLVEEKLPDQPTSLQQEEKEKLIEKVAEVLKEIEEPAIPEEEEKLLPTKEEEPETQKTPEPQNKVEQVKEEEEDSLITANLDELTEYMAASKPVTQEKSEIAKKVRDESIVSIMYSAAKKVAIVGVVYFVGYMNWSVAWLICPLLLSVIRDQMRSKHNIRREVAKGKGRSIIAHILYNLTPYIYSKRPSQW